MSAVIFVVLFWILIFLADLFLKNYRRFSRIYKEFLEENGICINFAQVKWYTTRFNRCFVRWGKHHPRLFRSWFTAGVWFGVIMMVISVLVLSWTLVQALRKASPEQVLTPVLSHFVSRADKVTLMMIGQIFMTSICIAKYGMPGVNLPWTHIFYYMLTLTVAGAFHEIGHAFAAVREQVRFFMILYPGAFVDLYTEHQQQVTAINRNQ